MATKMLMQRTMGAPLTEVSLNKPRLLTSASRKRSVPSLAASNSSDSTSEQQPHKKCRTAPRKSVRFDLSQNTQHASQLPPIDALILDALWFSHEDLFQIRMREGGVIKVHKFCDYYIHQMTCLLGVACGACEESDDCTPQLFVAQSPARGLEKEVLPCVRHRRKEVIQTLLRAQRALQKHPQKFTPEFQQTALSQHYIRLARPSSRLAQLIAQGDELALQSEA